MSLLHRRTFLVRGGSLAVVVSLPLAGCGGGGPDYPPVRSDRVTPMAVTMEDVQYRTVGRSHTLVIRLKDGSERSIGGVGFGEGRMNAPAGVAVHNGLAYVVELGNERVQVFDATGHVVRTFGDGELFHPGGIAAGKNEIYVADSRSGRIVVFSPTGTVLGVLGAGHLSAPRGMHVLADGLLVADPGLRKVLKLGLDGSVQQELGRGWVLPWDVTTDGTYAYVADVSRNELGVTTLSGDSMEPLPLPVAPANVWFRKDVLNVIPFV